MQSPPMSPIILSPRDRLVTVFGGGRVALRKCLHFNGFRIRVVADSILPELESLADEVVIEAVDPSTAERYMEGSDIVIAATSDHGLNDSIRDLSMSKGLMTNSAHGGGDVLIPSTVRRDGWMFCVSSEGHAPAFPPYVASVIDRSLDESYDRMLVLLTDMRPDVFAMFSAQPDRAAFLAGILSDERVWEILREGDTEAARRYCLGEGGRE